MYNSFQKVPMLINCLYAQKFCLKFDSSTECPQISLYDSKSLYKWIYGSLYSHSRAKELMKLNLWCYVCQIFLVIFFYWNTLGKWSFPTQVDRNCTHLAANSGPGALPWWPLSGANVQYFQVWCPKHDGMEGKISVTHHLAHDNDNNLCF